MKIVFIGCVKFSRDTLQKLIELKAEVVGIISKEESNFNSDFYDVSIIADLHGIPSKKVKDINHPNNISWIKNLSPDILFCFGWSSLLNQDLLNLAPMGVVGYHSADLPNNKGRHPLIWAKVLGLAETASTFFFLDETVDGGDILSQLKISIDFEDCAEDLYNKMTNTAINQIESFLPKLTSGSYIRLPQDKAIGNIWRKRGKKDGYIDFRMTTNNLCNLVRAISKPYFGAHCTLDGVDFKVWKVRPGSFVKKNIEPGKVLSVLNNYIEVKTADSSILLVEHEIENLPQVNSYFL
jgi:methionyl-tRNA formyltransferase